MTNSESKKETCSRSPTAHISSLPNQSILLPHLWNCQWCHWKCCTFRRD